jgi:dTDP-4-amino-4,6-dideoxygalactose transaminase
MRQSLDIFVIQRIQKGAFKSEKDYTDEGSTSRTRIAQQLMTEHVIKQTNVLVEENKTSTKPPKRIPLAWPIIDDEMKAAALSALDEKLVMGESVYKFEEEFARYCGTKYAVSTGSGTAALSISLQALGIGHGNEVVTTPFSFIATANAVLHAGADPVFADVEDSGVNLSPIKARKKIGAKTRAVIPVHLYGHVAEMDEFLAISHETGVRIVEDACQAHGAEIGGRRVGSIGDAGCFSFYPAKNLTVGGDGGMITTSNEELAEAAMSIRDCGRDKNSKYSMGRIGYTSRLNSINAAIGRVQLKRLDGWNEARRRLASRYRRELGSVGSVKLPPSGRNSDRAVYHLFVVRTNKREQVKKHLEKNGVETGVHYPVPIHLQVPYRQLYGYSEGAFPLSESLSNEVLSLPMYPTLTEEEVVRICDALKDSLRPSTARSNM